MNHEKKVLLSNASVVSGLTLLSRVLGFVRDSVVARILGASAYNDIFNIAYQIPNLARRVLGEGALSAFIVPLYHGEEKAGGHEQAFRFLNKALTVMTILGAGLTVLGMLLAQPLFMFFGGLKHWVAQHTITRVWESIPISWDVLWTESPVVIWRVTFIEGWTDGGAQDLAYLILGTELTRIMFPFLLILTLCSLFMGACHANKRFVTPSLGSSAINLVMIAVASVMLIQIGGGAITSDHKARFVYWLAAAVMAGVTIRLFLMWPTLWRLGWRWRWLWDRRDRAILAMFAKMGAATFAAGLAQLNISINLMLANWCGTGSVTYLYNGNRLIQFPLALLASGLATALVPTISRQYQDGDLGKAREMAGFAIRIIWILIIPATVGFWVLGRPIYAMYLQGGEWTAIDTINTSRALKMYALGLPALAVLRLLIPIFYAKGDVKTPVRVAAWSLAVNILANLILMQTPLSFAGLALGASVSSIFNATILWLLLQREVGSLWEPRMTNALTRCAAASAVMGLSCWGALRVWDTFWPVSGLALQALQTSAVMVLGVSVYLGSVTIFRLEDMTTALNILRRRRLSK